MKKKNAILLLLTLFVVSISPFTLVKQRDRTSDYVLNAELVDKINSETKGKDAMEILNYSVKTTAAYLTFSEHNDVNYAAVQTTASV